MSGAQDLPSEELLVEAIVWLLQLDMNDPRNVRPEARPKKADGEECGPGQRKR